MTRLQSTVLKLWMAVLLVECGAACFMKDPIQANAWDLAFFLVYSPVAYLAFFLFLKIYVEVSLKILPFPGKSPALVTALTTATLAGAAWTIFSYIRCRAILVSNDIFFGNPIFMAAFAAVIVVGIVVFFLSLKKELADCRDGAAPQKSKIPAIPVFAAFVVLYVFLNIVKIWDIHIVAPKKPDARENLPNVVLITLDTVSSIHSGFYFGGKDTPTLNELARNGVAFPDTTASMPLTGPSHATILTGLIPQHHGVLENSGYMSEEFTTITEVLGRNGYNSAAFVNMLAGIPKYNFTQGFDTAYSAWKGNSGVRYKLERVDLFMLADRVAKVLVAKGVQPMAEYESLWLALKWIKGVDEQRPFFLWFHTYLAHAPYAPPERVKKMFGVSGVPGWNVEDNFAATDSNKRLDAQKLKNIEGLYHGDIYMADECVKKIHDELKARNLLKNTLFIVTSDHGETFQRHTSFMGHERELYEDTIRVPAVFSFPGKIPALGARFDNPRLADLMPTILEFLGIEAPPTDGKSFLPLLTDANAKLPEREPTSFETIPLSGHTYKIGFRDGVWKYFYDLKTGEEFLFNLESDFLEQRNLMKAPEYADQAGRFRELQGKWFAETKPKTSATNKDMSPETIKQLKSLGYLR